MQHDRLADRLMNYSDALVAAAFVFMGGVGAAIGEPDTRCELADSAPKVILAILIGGGAVLFALRWLRLWTVRLRSEGEVSDEASQVLSRLDRVRLAATVVFILGACGFVLLSLTDDRCAAVLSSAA